jgi:hypothetical protein
MAKSSRVKSKGSSKKQAKPAAKARAKAKPAKVAAKKAAPKKAAPKKAAPKKAAPKKAAPKKAAPKKAAPIKAAPIKAAPIKAAPTKTVPKAAPIKTAPSSMTSSAIDDGWSDVETSAPRPARISLSSTVPSDHHAKVAQHVLHLYQSTIDPDAELATVLSVDPNDFDLDPSPFYEALEATFKVEDPSKHEFAGYGGTLKQTIEFIAARWKGGEIKTSEAFE